MTEPRRCSYCGMLTPTPCIFLNTSLGCTDSYYVNRLTPAKQGPAPKEGSSDDKPHTPTR